MARREGPHYYEKGTAEIGPIGRFTPGSSTSLKAEWLSQVGLAGVEVLNGAEVQRLASGQGAVEVEGAIAHARKIGEEIGATPDVHGLDLIELARAARASKERKNDRQLAERVNSERVKLYTKIAQSAGAIATGESKLAS